MSKEQLNKEQLKKLEKGTPVAIVTPRGTVLAGLFQEVNSVGNAYAVSDPTGVPKYIPEDAEVYPIDNSGSFELVFQESCVSRPGLRDTIKPMVSDDYRERFKAEYMQLAIRQNRSQIFLSKIKNAVSKGEEEPKHDCPTSLLQAQCKAMDEYRKVLEERAGIEHIDLIMPTPFPIDDWWKWIEETNE